MVAKLHLLLMLVVLLLFLDNSTAENKFKKYVIPVPHTYSMPRLVVWILVELSDHSFEKMGKIDN